MIQELIEEYGIELILASQSPRRSQLIEGANIPFQLSDNYSVDEVYPLDIPSNMVPLYLADLKSNAYPNALSDSQILITADTIVILDGRVLGKPAGRDDAIAMLEALSGNMHEVVTGVTIRNNQFMKSFSALSRVFFRQLTREEIIYYIDNFRPFDKAGSYGIQEWIGYVGIEKIEGSFYNVMGLPIQKLYVELTKFITANYIK